MHRDRLINAIMAHTELYNIHDLARLPLVRLEELYRKFVDENNRRLTANGRRDRTQASTKVQS